MSSLSLAPLDGNVASTTIYIRLNAPTEGSHSGSLVHSSVGVDAVSFSLSGSTAAGVVLGATFDDDLFKMWPNPATDRIFIRGKVLQNNQQLSLYTLGGVRVNSYKLLQNNEGVELDLTNLSQGMYVIELTNEGKKVTRKFWKE